LPNRQFYTMKFKSSRLKEYEYNFDLTFEQAQENGEIIALADNQILRSIRDIQNRKVDLVQLEEWYAERDKLKKQKSSKENSDRIIELKSLIYNMMYIPEYITVVMEHTAHYKYIFENGLLLNGKKYLRISSSASQSRVSTVVLCDESIINKLEDVLDNGRNKNKRLAPSKFNAYKGLAGSATKVVSTPRFCVVPDAKKNRDVTVNFVTETSYEEDDDIDVKTINQEFNLFDGQGLISYGQAEKWSKELGLDYVPAQWCIRQNFLKGMLCTFDIHKFCEEKNNGNYNIKTIYKDENGDNILVDLKEIDVIISESQFKLWDSFDSIEVYKENCIKNNLQWGISIYTPKETKDILTMNYQFNQTLNWNKKDIQKVCEKTVDWISGVTADNIYYTLLFLIGENITEESLIKYISSPQNYWVKSLIVNHELIKDKYIKNKIYNLIKKKIKKACLGDIIVDGNYQVIVSDPFAQMQHICGKEITGLLQGKQYYSNYWNDKNVKIVDSMRAPLTFRSEHLKLNLVNNNSMDYWYKYCTSGIIVNVHGMETLHWAGSDFDMDILATTSDLTVINGVYSDELPVVYEAPKPKPIELTPYDLYNADLFAFGSIIGSITNKSTSAYALLPLFKDDSEEYKRTMKRIKMCTKLQSAQIDKAKIGKEVKGIPKIWVDRQKQNDSDVEEVRNDKELYNSILLDRHPYFFKYLYKDTKRKYMKHVNGYDLSFKQKFGISLNDAIHKQRRKPEEQKLLDVYYKYMPVIDSDCVMNVLCKHIEAIDFNLKEKLKVDNDLEIYKHYMRSGLEDNRETYLRVLEGYNNFRAEIKDLGNMGISSKSNSDKHDDSLEAQTKGIYEGFKKKMIEVCPNVYELVNYLVEIFYVEYPKFNKDFLWNIYGKYLFANVKLHNVSPVLFPIHNTNGSIEYLNKKFELKEVII
jgi:hypothetical protein